MVPEYDRWVILRCTRKLLAVIGPALVPGPAPAPSPEDWYANLLWRDRRKCLLLTHSATLFRSSRPTCARMTCGQPVRSRNATLGPRLIRLRGYRFDADQDAGRPDLGNMRADELVGTRIAGVIRGRPCPRAGRQSELHMPGRVCQGAQMPRGVFCSLNP
jgi:uncharacterized protein DUF6933